MLDIAAKRSKFNDPQRVKCATEKEKKFPPFFFRKIEQLVKILAKSEVVRSDFILKCVDLMWNYPAATHVILLYGKLFIELIYNILSRSRMNLSNHVGSFAARD